jgi:hypothetical protein
MDRIELRKLLSATEHQIAQGEVLLQNQRWRVEHTKREGEDTADADEALRSLLHHQGLQEQHCAKLKRLLEESGRPG